MTQIYRLTNGQVHAHADTPLTKHRAIMGAPSDASAPLEQGNREGPWVANRTPKPKDTRRVPHVSELRFERSKMVQLRMFNVECRTL